MKDASFIKKNTPKSKAQFLRSDAHLYWGDQTLSKDVEYVFLSFDETNKTKGDNLMSGIDLIRYIGRPTNRMATIAVGSIPFFKRETQSTDDKLEHIVNAINESRYLLDLKEDWDDEGANATNFDTFKKATSFLLDYSKYIMENQKQIIATPYIDITRDGSISISWNTESANFIIIFKKNSNEYAYFYGQEKISGRPFKYAVKINDKVDEITALWMSKNLK